MSVKKDDISQGKKKENLNNDQINWTQKQEEHKIKKIYQKEQKTDII